MRKAIPGLCVDVNAPINWQAGLNRGLVSRWVNLPFGQWGGGVLWRDLCRANDGTRTNMGAGFSPTTGWSGPRGRPGGFGTLAFDGVDDFVSVPHIATWNLTGDFTIRCWVRYTVENVNWWQNAMVAHDSGGGTVPKWIFSHDPTHPGTIFHINGGVTATLYGNSWTPTLGTWYYLGVSRIGSGWTFYRQGRNDGTASNAIVIPTVITPLTFGTGEGTTGRLSGYLDDIKIWTRGLSDTEMLADYNDSIAGSPRTLTWVQPWWMPKRATTSIFSRRGFGARTGSRQLIGI